MWPGLINTGARQGRREGAQALLPVCSLSSPWPSTSTNPAPIRADHSDLAASLANPVSLSKYAFCLMACPHTLPGEISIWCVCAALFGAVFKDKGQPSCPCCCCCCAGAYCALGCALLAPVSWSYAVTSLAEDADVSRQDGPHVLALLRTNPPYKHHACC